MTYKFNCSSISDKEIDIAKKASEIFSKFKQELNANGLLIDDITVGYSLDGYYKRYVRISK